MSDAPVTRITRMAEGIVRGTGEVVDISITEGRGRRKKGARKVFALIDVEATAKLDLTPSQWRVLMQLIRAINKETGESRVSTAEIAREVGMAASNVSRTLSELRARRIVRTITPGAHRVSPHIAFRGSADEWDLATDETPEPDWSRP